MNFAGLFLLKLNALLGGDLASSHATGDTVGHLLLCARSGAAGGPLMSRRGRSPGPRGEGEKPGPLVLGYFRHEGGV